MLTLDGQVGFHLKRGDRVEIRQAAARIRLLRFPAEALLLGPPDQAQVGRAVDIAPGVPSRIRLAPRPVGRTMRARAVRRAHADRAATENLAVIEAVTVPLAAGLNAVTGETGAGKSIVVDAILLVMGARAQPDLIRTGAETAVIEAVFELGAGQPRAGGAGGGGPSRAGGDPRRQARVRRGPGGTASS